MKRTQLYKSDNREKWSPARKRKTTRKLGESKVFARKSAAWHSESRSREEKYLWTERVGPSIWGEINPEGCDNRSWEGSSSWETHGEGKRENKTSQGPARN